MYQISCENNATESIELDSADEYIISVSWNSGSLAAAHFKMNSMELYLMQEAIDLKPHFSLLHNLFRQLNGVYIIASGPREFLLEVMTLIGLPSDSDPNDYRVGHTTNQSISTASFLVYGNDSKSISSNRQRVMALKLPGMLENSTDFNRKLFIESVLPIHQSMVLQSIGNLLKYLDANWSHLFLRNDTQPIIVDVKVYRMEKQILMDRETFHALHIFSPIEHHPSGFIKGTISDCKEGFSLYAIMNTCYSKIGKNMLKLFLNQPICDIVELNLRHSIIGWCLRQQNVDIFMKLKQHFKNLGNIGVIFIKLKTQNVKPIYWKLFKNTINSVNIICEICMKIKQSGETEDFINELSDWVTKYNLITIMLSTIENIIDIDESMKQGRFIVKYGVDQELDNKKNSVALIFSKIYEMSRNIVNNMPSFILAFNITHIAEFGFVIGKYFNKTACVQC